MLEWSFGYKTFTCERQRKWNWAQRDVKVQFGLDKVLVNPSKSFGEITAVTAVPPGAQMTKPLYVFLAQSDVGCPALGMTSDSL